MQSAFSFYQNAVPPKQGAVSGAAENRGQQFEQPQPLLLSPQRMAMRMIRMIHSQQPLEPKLKQLMILLLPQTDFWRL